MARGAKKKDVTLTIIAERLGVARTRVWSAYEELRDAGKIKRHSGSYTMDEVALITGGVLEAIEEDADQARARAAWMDRLYAAVAANHAAWQDKEATKSAGAADQGH